MVVLKNVDVLSAARMAAVINVIVGIVIGVLAFIFAGSFAAVFGVSALRIAGIGAIIIIIVPLVLLIAGFIVAAIETWLYNVIARKVGGIKLDLKKGILKSIDLMSAGKIAAVLGAIIGVIAGIILLIAGLVEGSTTVAVFGVVGIFGFAILLAIVFFVSTVIAFFIYNCAASWIGGLKLNFKGKELKSLDAVQFAKLVGIFSAVEGLVAGVIVVLRVVAPMQYTAMNFGHVFGVFAIIVFPILYFIIGFVVSLIEAWLYNWLASKIGGVKYTLV